MGAGGALVEDKEVAGGRRRGHQAGLSGRKRCVCAAFDNSYAALMRSWIESFPSCPLLFTYETPGSARSFSDVETTNGGRRAPGSKRG